MNITGIITEYNPFHNGHKFHLEEAKKQTNCDGPTANQHCSSVGNGLFEQ